MENNDLNIEKLEKLNQEAREHFEKLVADGYFKEVFEMRKSKDYSPEKSFKFLQEVVKEHREKLIKSTEKSKHIFKTNICASPTCR